MLVLSAHAARQCTRRGISRTEILQALAHAETTYSSRQGPEGKQVILGTTANGRRLKVVVLMDRPSFVVTVADRDQEG